MQVLWQVLDLQDLIHSQNNTMRKLILIVPILVIRKLRFFKEELVQGLDVKESDLIPSALPSFIPSTLNKLCRVGGKSYFLFFKLLLSFVLFLIKHAKIG